MVRWTPWLVMLALFVAGCGGNDAPEPATTDGQNSGEAGTDVAEQTPTDESEMAEGEETTTTPQPANGGSEVSNGQAADPPIPMDTVRRSMEGRWMLTLSQQGANFPLAIIDVDQGDDEAWGVTLVAHADALGEMQLEESTADSESIQFALSTEQGGAIDFQGNLAEGEVRGNLLFGGGRVDPSRMVATQLANLEEAEPEEIPGRQELIQAFTADNPLQGLLTFAEENSENPLALDAYERLFGLAKTLGIEEDDIEQAADQYVKLAAGWGSRMEQMAHINIGFGLASTGFAPELALAHLNAVQEKLDDSSPDGWPMLVEMGLERAETALVIHQVMEGEGEEQEQAVARLREMQSSQAFNAVLLYTLASYAEQQEETDEAIQLYARLAVLPMMEQMLLRQWSQEQVERPLPSETLARLWEEKHGETDGLDEYLSEVYREALHGLAGERVEARPADEGYRIVLGELFTGAQCPPCVAADVATGALESSFGRTELIMLRYHQHIPGPDPLANEDAEARFFYYNGRGTPTLAINGEVMDSVGGFLDDATDLYQRLHDTVDEYLDDKSDLQFALSADAENGIVKIAAQVAGDEELGENARLRLVLAEEEISFIAANGIRFHEMVVRSMPGGPEGIEAEEGRFQFQSEVSVSELRQQLLDYLTDFEEGQQFDFPIKPLELSRLWLVAFVQDDETKEVLHAVTIPVSGDLTAADSEEADQGAAEEQESPQPADEEDAESDAPASESDSEAPESENSTDAESPEADAEKSEANEADDADSDEESRS